MALKLLESTPRSKCKIRRKHANFVMSVDSYVLVRKDNGVYNVSYHSMSEEELLFASEAIKQHVTKDWEFS